MRWLVALSLLAVCNAVTTNINERIATDKKTFACKFKLVHDYTTVNLKSSKLTCTPKKPKVKTPIDVTLVSDDGLFFVGTIKINPTKIVSMAISGPTSTTFESTTEGTTFTWPTTVPVAGNFSEEEVEFKEIYANATADIEPLYSHGCGIDNVEMEMRRVHRHMDEKSYTNMQANQFWANAKINWNFVTIGDEYEKFSVYKDVNLGLAKEDVDTVVAAMKQIEARTCFKFERVKPTKGQPWLLILRDSRHSDLSCQLSYVQQNLVGKDIAGLGDIFWLMKYAGSDCFPGAYAWYGSASPQAFVISKTHLSSTNQGTIGLVVHELLHNLGLGHTQKRQDAKDHLDIKWENIEKNSYSQYEPCIEAKDPSCKYYNAYGTPYDCNSIMHYADVYFLTQAARSQGLKTMVAKNPATCDVTSGKSQLSANDIDLINKMYCKDVVQEQAVTSPNYPSNYPDSKDADSRLTVATGSVVELTFTNFNLEAHGECGYDWVQVVDGDNSVLMEKKCGTTVPVKVTSKTNVMVVKFHSDSSQNRAGFRATWKKVTNKPAPVDGKWGDWKGWSTCSNSKDGKSTCKKVKTRICNNPPATNGGKACEGDSEEKADCTSNDLSRPTGHPNCVIHGAWTAWSAPSTCNSECKATKTRTCTNPEPINDSDKCIGDASQTGACTGGDCSSGTSGTVKSPNYPSNYDNDKHLTFPLEVASGSSIELEITDIDIEPDASCNYDYVQVLNSDNSQLVKACGTTKPAVLKSTGNKMSVVFHSDGSVVHKGFSATWKAVEAAAVPSSGEIKSPNYPGNYPDNLNRKEYKIAVAAGKKVELTIADFAIEADGSTCPYDNLKAYDTPAGGSSTLIAGICGTMDKYETLGPWTSGAWVSTSNIMTVYFTSDSSVNYKGFRATWKQID